MQRESTKNQHTSRKKQKGFVSGIASREQMSLTHLAGEANESVAATLRQTNSSVDGLIKAEALGRLHLADPNEVAHDKAPHALMQLLLAFNNPFVLVLLGLSIITFFTDVYFAAPDDRSWTGLSILLTMVSVSSLLRFFQEYRSNKAAERLKSMVRTTAYRNPPCNRVRAAREAGNRDA
jgi:P-type Mg2+ transporter